MEAWERRAITIMRRGNDKRSRWPAAAERARRRRPACARLSLLTRDPISLPVGLPPPFSTQGPRRRLCHSLDACDDDALGKPRRRAARAPQRALGFGEHFLRCLARGARRAHERPPIGLRRVTHRHARPRRRRRHPERTRTRIRSPMSEREEKKESCWRQQPPVRRHRARFSARTRPGSLRSLALAVRVTQHSPSPFAFAFEGLATSWASKASARDDEEDEAPSAPVSSSALLLPSSSSSCATPAAIAPFDRAAGAARPRIATSRAFAGVPLLSPRSTRLGSDGARSSSSSPSSRSSASRPSCFGARRS